MAAALGPDPERPLGLAEARAFFPEATQLSVGAGGWSVLGPGGDELGWVLTSLPGSEHLRGYVGAADVLLAADSSGVLAGGALRWSADTPGHVADVAESAEFWAAFRGRSLDELRGIGPAASDWRAAGFDAVSGATRTSDCVLRSAAHALGTTGGQPAPGWRDALLGCAALGLLAVAAGWIGGRSSAAWAVRASTCAALGFVLRDLLSLSLLSGWCAAGVPWRAAAGMAALVLAAFAAPLILGRNAYCSHVCPLGTLQVIVAPRVRGARAIHPPAWLAFALLRVPLALVLVAAAATVGLELDPAHLEAFDGFGLGDAALVSLGLLLLGLVAGAWVPMAYCRFGCGTGALLTWVQRGWQGGRRSWAGAGLSIALALALAFPSVQHARRAAELEGLLDVLAGGLVQYRDSAGALPGYTPSTAAELVPLLLEAGALDGAPLNPATGEPYGADPFEVDRVWYSLEAGEAACVLEIVSEDGGRVLASRRVP